MKDKSGKSVSTAFQKVFNESNRKPEKLWIDKGKECYNKDVKSLGVDMYSTENEEKSCVVERWIELWKKRCSNIIPQTQLSDILIFRWIGKYIYNNSKHSSIKMTPVIASEKKNWNFVWMKLYDNGTIHQIKPKFAIGDKVRITKKKTTFEKGYTPRWTEEIFTIGLSQVYYTDPQPIR